jgi:sporulation protein YlmC with PRC-barrel domain
MTASIFHDVFGPRRKDMTKPFIIVAAAGVVWTISMALAQAPERPAAGPAGPPGDSVRPGSPQIVTTQGNSEWLASKLKGTAVLGSDNQKVGDIVDILLDKAGQVRALIVGVGGVLGVGAKEVAIELSEFRETPASDGSKAQLKVPMTKEQLSQAPNFKPLPSPPATTGSAPSGSPPPGSPSR